MRTVVAIGTLVVTLAIGRPARAADAAPVNMRYMGDVSCGSWPKGAAYVRPEKALPLNWVLGFIDGRAAMADRDLLSDVDIPSVSAWMDNYCQAHPLETILTGSFVLESELTVRLTAHTTPGRPK